MAVVDASLPWDSEEFELHFINWRDLNEIPSAFSLTVTSHPMGPLERNSSLAESSHADSGG